MGAGIGKIALFIVLSPLIGMVLGSCMMVVTTWVGAQATPAQVDKWFRRLQLVSSGIFSYSHGTNDAQKVMGIIAVVLYGTIWADRPFHVPFWVILICHAAIALGTALRRLADRPHHGPQPHQAAAHRRVLRGDWRRRHHPRDFRAWAFPSPPPTPSPARIVGVGATRGTRAVRWGVAGRIVWAWVLTIPAAAAVSAAVFVATRTFLAMR